MKKNPFAPPAPLRAIFITTNQTKKILCAPCAFARNTPKKWGAWGAKSNNITHNDTYNSFIINKLTHPLSAPHTQYCTPFLEFSYGTNHRKIPLRRGRRGMSLPQNKTLLISKIKTIPRIKVQDKKNPLRLRLREQFPPKKWGAWGAKSDNKNHNENHKSFIIK